MPIVSSDIQFFLAAPGASSGSSATSTVYNSLGKYVSTTQISNTALNNLFPDLTGAQNAASQVDYQCVFILNNTASGDTALNGIAWLPLSGFVAGAANIALAVDTTGATLRSTSSVQAGTIANALTSPGTVGSYVGPSSTSAGGLSVANLAPNNVLAVWIRRTATNSAPLNNDGFVLEYDFDTMA